MSPPLGVQRAALRAAVIHLTREEAREDCAQNQYPAQHYNRQNNIREFLHSVMMASPLIEAWREIIPIEIRIAERERLSEQKE